MFCLAAKAFRVVFFFFLSGYYGVLGGCLGVAMMFVMVSRVLMCKCIATC